MKLGMTPVLSFTATDNVGVSRVTVSVIANGVLVSTHQGSLFSGSAINGVWRANLSFSGNDYVGTWQLKAVAFDSAGNASTEFVLREIPVSSS
jgi:hypothetical protein